MTAVTLPSFNPTRDSRIEEIQVRTEELATYIANLPDTNQHLIRAAIEQYTSAAHTARKAILTSP